jgi:hypothetical protein
MMEREVARCLGAGGALLRLQRVAVHILAAEAFERGDQVGADALRHKADGALTCGSSNIAPPSEPIAYARHRLDAAGHDQVFPAGAHLHRRGVDRLQPRRAEAVELHPRHVQVPAGVERGGAGDVAALLADRRDAAQHDIVHLGWSPGRCAP